MSGKRVVDLIGKLFVAFAALGFILWVLQSADVIDFGFGSLLGIVILAVVGAALTVVARRM